MYSLNGPMSSTSPTKKHDRNQGEDGPMPSNSTTKTHDCNEDEESVMPSNSPKVHDRNEDDSQLPTMPKPTPEQTPALKPYGPMLPLLSECLI